MASAGGSFQLFSSLHYSPRLLESAENTAVCEAKPCPFYILTYHRDRMAAAAQHFGWPAAVDKLKDLDEFRQACEYAAAEFTRNNGLDEEVSALKLRTLLTSSGVLTIEVTLIPAVTLSRLFPKMLDPHASTPPLQTGTYSIHLDTIATPATSFTKFKTTARDHYESARTRCGITSYTQPAEVLLWSENGKIMEGSLTNVYFYRIDKGGWITPRCEDEAGVKGAGGTGGTVRRWLLEQGLVKIGDVSKEEVKEGEFVWISNGVRGLILGRVVALNLPSDTAKQST